MSVHVSQCNAIAPLCVGWGWRLVAAIAFLAAAACGPSWARKPAIVTQQHATHVRIRVPAEATDDAKVRHVDEGCRGHLDAVRRALESLQLELHDRLQDAGFVVIAGGDTDRDVELRFEVDLVDCRTPVRKGATTQATMRVILARQSGPWLQVEEHDVQLRETSFASNLADHVMNDVLGSPEMVQLAERKGATAPAPAEAPREDPVPTDSSEGPSCSADADCAGGQVCTGGVCKPVVRKCDADVDCPGELVCNKGLCAERRRQ